MTTLLLIMVILYIGVAAHENEKRKTADFEFDLRCGIELTTEQREASYARGAAMAKAMADNFYARQHQKPKKWYDWLYCEG